MPKRKVAPVPEPTYDVEFIRKARVTENEAWEYYIKWGGYPEDENSWEPESNLTGCRRILKSFWDQVGPLVKATAPALGVGYEVKPSTLWITRESQAYQRSVEKKSARLDPTYKPDNNITDISSTSPDDDQSYRESSDEDIVSPDDRHVHDQVASEIVPKTNINHKQPSVQQPPQPRSLPSRSVDESIPLVAPLLQPSPSTSTPTPKPKASEQQAHGATRQLPEHLRRKLNPRVKPIALPVTRSDGPMGISTKARLSALGGGSSIGTQAGGTPTPQVQEVYSAPVIDNAVIPDVPVRPQLPVVGDGTFREPFEAAEELTNRGSDNQASAVQTSTSNALHFSKRWRWSGQLAIGNNESDVDNQQVGGILLTDSTPLTEGTNQLGIQSLIPSHRDSLCLRHPYSIASLPITVHDLNISQFARMIADQSHGENHFDDVVAYMTKYELFSQVPLLIGDRHAATMLVFPASLEYLWDQLDIPHKIREGQGLLVAIGFQAFEPPRGDLGSTMTTYHSGWKTQYNHTAASEGSIPIDCSRALLALSFPETLFKRLAYKECAIFTTPADNNLPGPDTLALKTILNNAPGCKIVPVLMGSARFIFIHVGAWDILHKLMGLVDRRLRRQDVRFYTYGLDPTAGRTHWGVKEVFPIGGIVTFTPRAISEDPEGVERLIGRLDEHPLWACYVLPSVVAMIPSVINSAGPDSNLHDVISALCGILIPIENGRIALTWHPPRSQSWQPSEEGPMPARISWMISQARLSELRGNDLLEECHSRLQGSQERTEKEVEASIVKDMIIMQSELRYEYRRFVIITDSTAISNTSREMAATATASKADIKDVFEFTHVKEFTFGDDYSFKDT